MDRRLLTSLVLVLAAAASSGCRDAPLAVNVKTNATPFAHAGEMQMFDYTGSPVTATLNGSASTDPDGTIVAYRWFSGVDAPDGGMGHGGPDPEDVVSPTVSLDQGTWLFTLFVIDDEGGVSSPSSVTIQVGNSGPSPEVIECAGAALQTIAEDCRLCLCGIDDNCRTMFVGCDQACWDFYTCRYTVCGQFDDSMEMLTPLTDCVTASCSAFFGGVGTFMAFQACLPRDPACFDTCKASVQGM